MTNAQILDSLDASAAALADGMTRVDAAVKALEAKYRDLAIPVEATVSIAPDPTYTANEHPNFAGRPAHRRVLLAWTGGAPPVQIVRDYCDPDGRRVALGDSRYKPRWEDARPWSQAAREDKLAALDALPALLLKLAEAAAERIAAVDAVA